MRKFIASWVARPPDDVYNLRDVFTPDRNTSSPKED